MPDIKDICSGSTMVAGIILFVFGIMFLTNTGGASGLFILLTLAWTSTKNPADGFGEWLGHSMWGWAFGAIISGCIVYSFLPALVFWIILLLFLFMLFLGQGFQIVIQLVADDDVKGQTAVVCILSGIGLVVMVVVVCFVGPAIGADALYRVPVVKAGNGSADMISIEHIRVVPHETAKWKADKKIGEIGHKFEVREPDIQFRDGELKWLTPLEYRGFFQAWGGGGSPGYIVVSAEKEYEEPQRILGFQMRCIPSALFNDELKRTIYFQYPQYYIKKSVFQLDDSGKPIYVTMLTTPTVWLTGDKPVGVVITNPETCENTFYNMNEVPSYVQRVTDEELTEDYLYWWGYYIHGWWNSWLGQQDVKKPTGGVDATETGGGEVQVEEGDRPDVFLIYGNDGNLYWFESMSTMGKATNSMVGYVLTNVKTGKMTFYATGSYYNDIGAAKAVQQDPEVSKVMGLRVSQPIMYLIEGNETWIIPVVTSSSEIKRIGVVHAVTGKTFISDSLSSALTSYKAWLKGETSLGATTTIGNVTAPSGNVTALVMVYDINNTLKQSLRIGSGERVVIIPQ